MDWRALATTFGLVFLAEIGDKTQLAVITLTAKTRAPGSVLLGACVALCVVSAIGVVGGAIVTRYVPAAYLEKIAALAFIGVGLWMLLARD